MKFPWFERYGLFYLPKKLSGWLIMVAAIVFAVYSFIDIDSRSHSSSDTLINFVFMLIIIGAVYTLIAFLTSFRSSK
jgi:hypothetical protein